MTTEIDAEKLARSQAEAISGFFGMEIPKPSNWLFETAEKIRQEKLLTVIPLYLPRRKLAEGISFPGLKKPLDSWLYTQIKDGKVAQDADCLPGEWILFDTTKRPNYKDGKQMYNDTPRFKEVLATLREQGQIAVPDYYKDVPKGSRFAISADEIDGNSAVVTKMVANILGLKSEQVSTPLYATFNYVGNLVHPELGQVNTWEWFKNNFERSSRLFGGSSDDGGLSYVHCNWSDHHNDNVGFRLQVSSPSNP